jgi:hypothetical protein
MCHRVLRLAIHPACVVHQRQETHARGNPFPMRNQSEEERQATPEFSSMAIPTMQAYRGPSIVLIVEEFN